MLKFLFFFLEGPTTVGPVNLPPQMQLRIVEISSILNGTGTTKSHKSSKFKKSFQKKKMPGSFESHFIFIPNILLLQNILYVPVANHVNSSVQIVAKFIDIWEAIIDTESIYVEKRSQVFVVNIVHMLVTIGLISKDISLISTLS